MNTKTKILIASVLKPVDDVRSYQKIGRSLAQTNKYDVNIIGFKSKKVNKSKNISLYPIFNYPRTSIRRLFASWIYYKTYLKVKPEIVIVSSPELLLVNYIIRIIFGTTILYDVQENYTKNLKYGSSYFKMLKPILSAITKVVEHSSRYFVSGYLLAEKVYETELQFISGKNHIILENKAVKPKKEVATTPVSVSAKQAIHMIYTGTIGKEYGTLEAVELAKKLHHISSNISLTIIGYSADVQYLKKLHESIRSSHFIRLIGGAQPLPHQHIIEAIEQSDIALLPYEVNPNLMKRIPTKFYDYMAYHKPMLVSENNYWEKLLSIYPAAIFIDFKSIAPQHLLEKLEKVQFYSKPISDTNYWDSEVEKLFNFIEKFI